MRQIRLTGQLAEPIGPFTDGVEAGGFLYVSGMLPLDANGDLVGVGDVVGQTGA
jgi:enamine deaminase RidA (YjgF/YER057c/UK114 family)